MWAAIDINLNRVTPYLDPKYHLNCCQDKSRLGKSSSTSKQDRSKMDRLACNSRLILKPSLRNQILNLKLHYLYHTPDIDIDRFSRILQSIDAPVAFQNPIEIYQNIHLSDILGVDCVVQGPIYHQWQQFSPENLTAG